MNKIFNLTSTFKTHAQDDGSVMIRGFASTADFDRAGDSISAEAWQKGGLKNFEKNPIILFNHDYDKPIGRATGLKAGPDGLELECKISKSAPANVAELVKDGVLGAFSVGFRVKDADYIKETDGLMIKDAELFEVSVVSVPCNQSATFSLAKSFDSDKEYEEFKKTFTNRVDLAGQSLAKDEVITSGIASDTPQSADINSADQEIKMDNQNIDLEAFAKKVAEDTAAKIAMKQAEQKAAEEAEAKASAEAEVEKAQALEAESIRVKAGVQTGVEALMADVQKQLNEKDAKFEEVIAKYSKDLEEKSAEITAMQNSKKSFSDRSQGDLSKFAKEFMTGHMLGVMTGKGWDTSYSQDLFEKAGVNYAANAGDIAQGVSTQIEKEIMQELKLAQAFREITINSQTQVLPIQTDALPATWGANTAAAGNLTNRPQVTGNQYNAAQVILKANRLVSTTFMDNNVDEEVLVNLMPMLIDSVARAHARAVDNAIINGTAGGDEGFNGLEALAGTNTVAVLDAVGGTGADTSVTAAEFLAGRKLMGKYGMDPSDLVYVVSQTRYYDLLADPAFADITDVGSDIATKITGTVGAIYGTPVIVSDQLETEANTASVGYCVNVRNHVIPRLRGVSVEQDYEVMNQRNVIVASQSLGFNQLRANNGTTDVSVVKLIRTDT
jgi:HK97 family phage prohead protease